MTVYLDAVFFPNLTKNENIFKQEGWRYDLKSKEEELKINGIVYNKYYKASNANIFLYGNLNILDTLKFIDKDYLSKFDKKQVDTKIELQKPFSKRVEVTSVIYFSICSKCTTKRSFKERRL